jgi:hypothetical protein
LEVFAGVVTEAAIKTFKLRYTALSREQTYMQHAAAG